MREKRIVFQIDDQILYFEDEILQVSGVPYLYTCRSDGGQRYLAFCLDIDIVQYLLILFDDESVPDISAVPDIFLSQGTAWLVTCGENGFSEDVVEVLSREDIHNIFS